jgi:hypothetical protein
MPLRFYWTLRNLVYNNSKYIWRIKVRKDHKDLHPKWKHVFDATSCSEVVIIARELGYELDYMFRYILSQPKNGRENQWEVVEPKCGTIHYFFDSVGHEIAMYDSFLNIVFFSKSPMLWGDMSLYGGVTTTLIKQCPLLVK